MTMDTSVLGNEGAKGASTTAGRLKKDYQMNNETIPTKEDIIERLKEDGYDGLYASFSGGHDSGGWDEFYAFKLKEGSVLVADDGGISFTTEEAKKGDTVSNWGDRKALYEEIKIPASWDIYTERYNSETEDWERTRREEAHDDDVKLHERYYGLFGRTLDDAYGSFAGEYSVTGNMWILPDGRSNYYRSESVEQHEDFNEEF